MSLISGSTFDFVIPRINESCSVLVFHLGVTEMFSGIWFLYALFIGCGAEEECFSDSDCEEGFGCVISHDHEGDDHSHGGTCEEIEPEE